MSAARATTNLSPAIAQPLVPDVPHPPEHPEASEDISNPPDVPILPSDPDELALASDRDTHLSTDSDTPSLRRDSLPTPSQHLTREYVISHVSVPSETLSSANARAAFITALLGDISLAKHAEDDAPLLRQLETRASILLRQSAPILQHASQPMSSLNHIDADALIALLALLAAKWPILLTALERESVALVVISTMRAWSHRPALVARCMTALRVFAVTDSMRKRLMFDGGLTLTLDLMSLHRADRRVQERASALIANVAFGCTHRKRRIARQGGLRRVIDAMTAFPNDQNLQLRAALTIRNLTHEAQVNQYIAGNEGAVEAIAANLLRFRGSSANPELRFQCVMALESLCREDERNRQRVVDLDLSPVILPKSFSASSMALTPRTIEGSVEQVNEDGDVVVEEEQILIPNLTANFRHGGALCPGRSFTNIVQTSSLASSVGSERPPTSPIGRLGSLCNKSPAASGNDARSANVSANGPEVTNDGKKVQAKPPDRKPSLIRAIVHAIRRDPDDALLLETALSLLTLISLDRPAVQTKIGQLGGVHVAVAAIRRHAKNPVIAARASALIRSLCFQEGNRSQITSGLVVLIAAAREHRKDVQAVREVVSALSNAAFEHEKNRTWVVNKGGVDAVTRAMNECGDKDVMVLEAGICALRNFVNSSEAGALCAANEGAIRAAVTALDKTKTAKSTGQRIVQEQAVLLLVDIARVAPVTLTEMQEIDAADWIENALAKLPPSQFVDVHDSGDKLISTLMEGDGGKFAHSTSPNQGPTPPSPTAISHKAPVRGIFAAFSLNKRAPAKPASSNGKKKQGGARSLVMNSGPAWRTKRISGRFRKGSVVSS